MIALDFSGIMFAAIHVDIAGGQTPHREYIRHLVLNSIRAINLKYRDRFGELFIIMDGHSWRRKIFPLYKYVRGMGRNVGDNDWKEIMDIILDIQEELKENLPFPVLKSRFAEADDIIGYLCQTVKHEEILIVSNDKDFGALLKYNNVHQHRPLDNKKKNCEFVTIEDPEFFEFELIVRGDEADGVPNIFCRDSWFKEKYEAKVRNEPFGERSPSVYVKDLAEWYKAYSQGGDTALRTLFNTKDTEIWSRFTRNRKLISLDLKHIPEQVQREIQHEIDNVVRNPMHKMIKYFMDNRMSLFMRETTAFAPNAKNVSSAAPLFGR